MPLSKEESIVFHSTKSKKDLADIIYNGQFHAGSVGGSMLGEGFYANLELSQAQHLNYGSNILKCSVLGVTDFLFLDIESYNDVFGSSDLFEQLDKLPKPQRKRTGFSKDIEEKYSILQLYKDRGGDSRAAAAIKKVFGNISMGVLTSRFATQLLQEVSVSTLKRTFNGLVYKGGFDGKSIVCWYPNDLIVPIEISEDRGDSWYSVSNFGKEPGFEIIEEGSLSDTFNNLKSEIQCASDIKSAVETLKSRIEGAKISRVDKSKLLGVLKFLSKFYSK